MSDLEIKISIPTDEDGFVLLKCPLCGEYFKLTPSDINADDVIQVWCPCCGLKSNNYLTEDVINLAMNKVENITNDLIYKELNHLEKQLSNETISLKSNIEQPLQPESPIIPIIDSLEIIKFSCCNRKAKIRPIVKLSGCYCPFCGVSSDGN